MGDALTTMLRHRIHRVVVADASGVYGWSNRSMKPNHSHHHHAN